MARPPKNAERLSKPVSCRLSATDYKAYLSKVQASGLSQSDFFRECVLQNKTTVTAIQKTNPDLQRMLFLFNKTSNNLNQLAHRANSDHLADKLSEAKYAAILEELNLIARYLKATLRHAD